MNADDTREWDAADRRERDADKKLDQIRRELPAFQGNPVSALRRIHEIIEGDWRNKGAFKP